MSKSPSIIYEPHPVSQERKAELNKKGFRIIDVIYKPADAPAAAETKAQDAPGGDGDDDEKDGPGDLTKGELQQLLKDAGIPFPANAKKADLLALLDANGLK